MSLHQIAALYQKLFELKIPYDTVMAADFADSECEASAKSCYSARA